MEKTNLEKGVSHEVNEDQKSSGFPLWGKWSKVGDLP
jgi:hypothetical protein